MQPRYAALIELETQLARAARGLLWNTHGPVSLDDGANLDGLGGVLGTLTAGIEEVLPERARQSLRERSQQWFHRGLDAPTARRLASLAWIGHAGTVQRLCKATGGCPAEVARRYFELGSESLILDLAAKANEQAYPDRWDAIAVPTVERGLLASLSRMAERHFREANDLPASRWLRAHGLGRTADRIRRILRERVPLSALLVTSERIKLRLDRLAS
ncbi:MAG: hypothetical protein CSA66_05060 [Proteobacteria bacterium]|nr:MAG: hypothetical protein CSA66_05060 [Pseudomonadota bacterium]